MKCAHPVHRRGPDDHERADDKRAVHVRECEAQIRVKTLLRLQMELAHFPFLAAECVHHPYRAQTLLRLREQGALLFLNRGRLAANAVREEINGGDNCGHDRERKQRQLPIDPDHHAECADQHNDRSKDIREALVVDRLDGLGIVGDAKARIA